MNKYTLYQSTTGKIKWHASGNSPAEVLARFEDCDGALAGHWDGNRFEIIDGAPVERPDYASDCRRAAWARLRQARDRALAETDWTQLQDAQCDRAAWAEYRQALRDLPSLGDDPDTLIWPVPPVSGT